MGLILRLAAATAAVLLLGGCETAATYHPREPGSATGYTDEQLAANRWRVTFTGNSATPRDAVENYLLLHAAEVTLKSGHRAFMFDTRDTEALTIYQSDFVAGRGWYWHSWPYGAGTQASQPITRYEAYAEIVLLTDDQAKVEPRAIAAQDVIDHLGPAAKSPQASHPPQP